jgi:ribonuclease Z
MQQLLILLIRLQILEIKNRLFLIDCGEGTQVQLKKIKSDFLKLIIFYFAFARSLLWVDRSSVYFTLLNRNTDLHSFMGKRYKKL